MAWLLLLKDAMNLPRPNLFTRSGGKQSGHFQKMAALRKAAAGITLIETLVATTVLGIAMTGMMSGISFMRIQNRAASQQMLAGSIATQLLEMFKAMPYSAIANSGTGGTICLVGYGTSNTDAAYNVPTTTSTTQPVPVEDVNSTMAGEPPTIANKLPEGYWQAQIQTLASDPNVKEITITISWDIYAGSTLPRLSYSVSTMVNSYFTAQ